MRCNQHHARVIFDEDSTCWGGAADGFVEEGEVWVDPLSAPIARRKGVCEGNPLCVPIGMAGVDLHVADAIFGDGDSIVNRVDEIACDDESWTGHSYASDCGNSGSVDSGMVVNLTDNNGNGFMEEVMIDDDNTSSMGDLSCCEGLGPLALDIPNMHHVLRQQVEEDFYSNRTQ